MSEEWAVYQKLVLSEIGKFNDFMDETKKNFLVVMVDIGMLKVKSGVWGFAGGLLVSLGAYLISRANR